MNMVKYYEGREDAYKRSAATSIDAGDCRAAKRSLMLAAKMSLLRRAWKAHERGDHEERKRLFEAAAKA